MYNNSTADNALNKTIVTTSAHMTIGSRSIGPTQIKEGTLNVNNACVSGSDYETGSVYAGELNVTLIDENISGNLTGDEEIKAWIDVAGESIPLGTFYVTSGYDVLSKSGKEVSITAYDKMVDLSDDESESFLLSGTPYNIISEICNKKGLTLANSQDSIESMTNGTITLPETEFNNYRDALSDVVQLLMAFAFINRNGQLEIKQVSKTVNKTINPDLKTDTSVFTYSMSFSKCGINGPSSSFLVKDIGSGNKTFYITDNSFTENMDDTTANSVLGSISSYLSTLSYTPFNFKLIIGNPLIELGDRLRVNGTGIHKNDTYEMVVMKYNYTLHGGETFSCVGENKRVQNAKSKTEKKIDKVAKKTASSSSTSSGDGSRYENFHSGPPAAYKNQCDITYSKISGVTLDGISYTGQIKIHFNTTPWLINNNGEKYTPKFLIMHSKLQITGYIDGIPTSGVRQPYIFPVIITTSTDGTALSNVVFSTLPPTVYKYYDFITGKNEISFDIVYDVSNLKTDDYVGTTNPRKYTQTLIIRCPQKVEMVNEVGDTVTATVSLLPIFQFADLFEIY